MLSSTRTGIVSQLRQLDPGAPEGIDGAGVASVSGRLAASQGAAVGSTAFDARDARVRALGEAVERYALHAAARWVPTTAARHHDVAARALDPRRLALPAPGEHPDFVPFDPEAAVAWVEGARLPGGEPILLPAEATLAHHAPRGPRFAWASSSGAGAGNTVAEAVRSGLREVLERDAFATTWLLHRAPPHVDLDLVRDPDVKRWRDHHRARGHAPSLAWLTNEVGYPVVMAQVAEHGAWRYVAGFGASLAPARAIRRAVEECEQGRLLLRHLAEAGARIPASEAECNTLESQLLYWQDPARLPGLAFLTQPRERLAPDALPDLSRATPREDVLATVRLIEKAGMEAYGVDLTPADLAPFPLRVVATLVAGAQPVRMGAKPWCLANRRLARAPGPLHARPPPFA